MPNNIEPGFWSELGPWIAGAYGAMMTWAWKHTHGILKAKAEATTVDALTTSMQSKATVQDVLTLAGVVKDKAEGKELSEARRLLDQLFAHHREDSKAILEKISGVCSMHQMFTEKALEELGRRPTREECARTRCGDFRKS